LSLWRVCCGSLNFDDIEIPGVRLTEGNDFSTDGQARPLKNPDVPAKPLHPMDEVVLQDEIFFRTWKDFRKICRILYLLYKSR